MNNSPMELVDLRKDVCGVLADVGESLIQNPKLLRPLKMFAERLDDVARQTDDLDMMFLNSYVSLFAGDMYFNLLTDVSSLVTPEDRDKLIKDLGKNLKDLAQAIINKDNKRTYEIYKQIGKIWTKDMPNLGKSPENGLYPQYPKRPEDTTLPLAAKRFNEYPATKHCENYLASGFPSDFHKDFDFITLDADIADEIVNYYVNKINEIRKEIKVNTLAFFDKNYGPIGAIVLANSIISKTRIDAIYVRLRRRLSFDQIKKGKRYLFSWGNVPGNDSERLLKFLNDYLNIGWVKNAEILKSNDGKTIHISKDENFAKIKIAENEEEATLNISDGRTCYLKVKKENGTLGIYRESLNAGDTVVIISDVLTTGDGILKTRDIIKENYKDVKVPYAVVFYDRMQGAERRLKEKGIKLKAIFTREDFAKEDIREEAKPFPLTDEVVPLSKEAEKELEEIFGKETLELMERGTVTL